MYWKYFRRAEVFSRKKSSFFKKKKNWKNTSVALSPLSTFSKLPSSVPFLFPPSLFPLWEIMWLFDLRRDEWQRFSKSSPVSITLRVKYQPWVSVSVGVCVCRNVYMSRLAHYAPGLSHAVTEGFDLPILSHTFIPTLPLLALFLIIFTLIFFFPFSQACPRCTHTDPHLSLWLVPKPAWWGQ